MRKETGQSLNERIRSRREAFGASIDQVSQWSGISADRWREIEIGTGDGVESSTLGQIASALATDFGSLLHDRLNNPRRSVARFRAANSSYELEPADLRYLALAAEIGRIGGELCRLSSCENALDKARHPHPVHDREMPWKQGYRLGEQARRRLPLSGTGPIHDLEADLRRMRVQVIRVPFSDPTLEAASLWEDGAIPVIVLNESSQRTRRSLPRRATLAHELCHLLHDSGEHDLTTQLSGREKGVETAIEQRARSFAPAFLAPRDEVRHWFRAGGGGKMRSPETRVIALARRWGLSFEGAAWHAKNCGLVQSRTAERLVNSPERPDQEWEREFESTPRPTKAARDPLEVRSSTLFTGGVVRDLVLAALGTGEISEGRAREILGWGS